MNISSIVIQAKSCHIDEIVEICKNSDFCDYHFHDKAIGKIVVTVEGDGIDEEMQKMKKIEKIPHVICADMMMAYSEDELDIEREKLNTSPVVPQMLNDENINLKDIVYRGDLKKKIN
ncbi:MAG: chaperone NapD [Campylobacteraceae bacterium]|nr:chaperone NapD [Campylobacteraceae bacterium]